MVFDHRVKHNGILYEAGENVPIEDKPRIKEAEPQKITEDVKEVKRSSLLDSLESEGEKPKRKGRPPKAREE